LLSQLDGRDARLSIAEFSRAALLALKRRNRVTKLRALRHSPRVFTPAKLPSPPKAARAFEQVTAERPCFSRGARPALILQPERVPFNGSVLGSAKGTWIINVSAAVYVEGTDSVLLNLTLEKDLRSTEDRSPKRRLGMLLPAPVLKEFCLREGVASDIRHWLEGTEGNGFLDLRSAA
jgi:hypothetical protein